MQPLAFKCDQKKPGFVQKFGCDWETGRRRAQREGEEKGGAFGNLTPILPELFYTLTFGVDSLSKMKAREKTADFSLILKISGINILPSSISGSSMRNFIPQLMNQVLVFKAV